MIDILYCIAMTAAFTSLAIESPLGKWAREILAGAPTEADFEAWRADGAKEEDIPVADYPRIDVAMQCQRCASVYVALAVSVLWLHDSPLTTILVTWACSWLGARLLLGIVREIEERL